MPNTSQGKRQSSSSSSSNRGIKSTGSKKDTQKVSETADSGKGRSGRR